jgi:SAM-dependent methyltransferase
LLPKELSLRGVHVTAVEIEPKIEMLSRKFFRLPQQVEVRVADARAFLRHDTDKYDLIFLDTFASESTPWHMLTVEAFGEMRERLNPGGRLIVNTVCFADPRRPALEGIEASLLAAFDQVQVYPGHADSSDPDELINVLLVAGEKLDARPNPPLDAPPDPSALKTLSEMLARGRPARPGSDLCTDDRSDLDYVQAPMRIRWRRFIWDSMSSNLLWD